MERSLWPREHGVYAQVSLPLFTGLFISPTLAGALIGSAVVAAFLLHEPLLVLAGGRGNRRKAELATTAKTHLAVLASGALAAGGGGFLLAPLPARVALMPLVGCGLLTLFMAWRHVPKTILGELLVALTFSLALLPVTLAGREPELISWIVVGIWTAVFGIQTLTVHGVKARGGRTAHLTAAIATALLVLSGLGAKMMFPVLIALAGPALVTIAVVVSRTGATRLRRIGWAFVCADSTTLFLILLTWPS